MVRGLHSQAMWNLFAVLLLLSNNVVAAPQTSFKSLEQCVASALIGENVQTRIQTPADATWEDARVGAVM
jgi:hypothetical protein